MHVKTLAGLLGGTVLASSLGVGLTNAQASTPHYAPATTVKAPPTTRVNTRFYTDTEIVQFVVFAEGPVAQKNPALAKTIRGDRAPAHITKAALDSFVAGLRKVDPGFHTKVTMALQRNDPYQARVALNRLNADIGRWLKTKDVRVRTAQMRADGWFWHDSYILTEMNAVAVWQAAAYSTVAAGAEAVVLVAIIPAAASYQFEMTKADENSRESFTATVTRALS